MESEHSALGHKLTFSEFLQILRLRGRLDEADRYETEFLTRFNPLLNREQILALPFKDLCAATPFITALTRFSSKNPRVLNETEKDVNRRYGVYFLKKMGKWPPKTS